MSAFSKKNPSPTIWKSNIHGKRGGEGGRGADKKMEHSIRYQKCGNEQFNSESLSKSLFFTNSHNYGNRQSYYAETLGLRRVSSGNMEMF